MLGVDFYMTEYQKIHISTLLKHYKRADIQQALVSAAERKEIAVSYGGTGYGKRPDVLSYPRDVLEMVKQGATSFHYGNEARGIQSIKDWLGFDFGY